MNQIMSNIKGRRSRREFLNSNIAENVVEEIIEAGRYAPSSLNKQPWKFIVITNKDAIKRLSLMIREKARRTVTFLPIIKFFKPTLKDPKIISAIKKTITATGDGVFYGAPLVIMVVSSRENGGHHAAKDCALASQNMMLYAHSVGISSCFIGRADFIAHDKAAKDMIGLPPHHVIESAIAFGYAPKGDLPVPQRKRNNIINWMR